MKVNEAKLQAFLARALYDVAAAQSATLVAIGDRLGLYKAMADGRPCTPEELARRTGTHERYVGEWLVNQACGGYVEYDPARGTFVLPAEQALVLAEEGSRAFLAGAFELAAGLGEAREAAAEAFRTGRGIAAGEYADGVWEGIDRLARARCRSLLVRSWIPALEGVAAKLESGALVADVGCGGGAALVVLAQAFPRSRFVGFDTHGPSIERARRAASAAGVAGMVRFEPASSGELPGEGYDLVTSFDSLHEMPEPSAAAQRVRRALRPEGTWLIVEPFAADRLEENFGPVGRLVSAVSALLCVPVSRAGGGEGRGALLGESGIAEIARSGGFTRVRRIADNPFSLVLEVRP